MNSRAKKEGDPNYINKTSKTPSSSRQWAGFRNPRIVRVSRTFGGKDRHSKVCTVRGLRDRRIRLSVPTAIQLYDLQDRLGLNQPSKVVDWLLEATKAEIDKLPPLQMPPGNFMTQFLQPLPSSSSNNSQPPSLPHHFFNPIKIHDQKDKWIASNDEGNQERISGYEAHIQAQNFFPTSNIQSSFPNFLNNSNALPYNSYYHNLEPNPNLSLSQFGNHCNFPNHHQEDHSDHMNYNSSQLYLPPFPQYTAMESAHDPRQINHFQFMSSSSQHHVLPNSLMPTLHLISSPLKSLSLNVNPIKILHSHETDNNERDKGGEWFLTI